MPNRKHLANHGDVSGCDNMGMWKGAINISLMSQNDAGESSMHLTLSHNKHSESSQSNCATAEKPCCRKGSPSLFYMGVSRVWREGHHDQHLKIGSWKKDCKPLPTRFIYNKKSPQVKPLRWGFARVGGCCVTAACEYLWSLSLCSLSQVSIHRESTWSHRSTFIFGGVLLINCLYFYYCPWCGLVLCSGTLEAGNLHRCHLHSDSFL